MLKRINIIAFWQLSSCWLVLLLALSVTPSNVHCRIHLLTLLTQKHYVQHTHSSASSPLLWFCRTPSTIQASSSLDKQQLEQQCSCKCNLPTLLVHHTCPQPTANIWAPLTCSLMSLMAWSQHNPLIDLDTTLCHFTVNSNDYASYMELKYEH